MAGKRKFTYNQLLAEAQVLQYHLMGDEAYLALLTASPIKKDDIQLLAKRAFFSSQELRRAATVVQAICHVTEGHTGVANLRIPAEEAVGVIRGVAASVNWKPLCIMVGELGLKSLAQYEEQAVDVDSQPSPSGQELWNCLVRMVSMDLIDAEAWDKRTAELLKAVAVKPRTAGTSAA